MSSCSRNLFSIFVLKLPQGFERNTRASQDIAGDDKFLGKPLVLKKETSGFRSLRREGFDRLNRNGKT